MFLRSQIAAIIDSQKEAFLSKDTGLERDILNKLPVIESFALIISGIRRCGKSTLLHQLLKERFQDAFYLSFEDPRLAGFEPSDFNRLNEEIAVRKSRTLFFDEIQLLENWERFVRLKLDEGFLVIVTGSNASLLSYELGTKLTGRHLTVELFPFSYSEFVRFRGLEFSASSLEQYLLTGGFPEYVRQGSGIILNSLFEDILSRDIAVRYGIRDVSSLRQMAVYLVSNIGKPVSGKSLTDMFGVSSNSTILEYFSHLENSYLFQFLPVFSYSLKTQLRNPRKVYTIDLGLFTENSIVFSDEKGRRLENLVYIHLRRKYNQLYYFKGKGECDFIAMEKGKVKEIIQVSYELNDMNFSREFDGLSEAMDFFSSKNGKIITYNYKDTFEKDGRFVEVVPAFDYLAD